MGDSRATTSLLPLSGGARSLQAPPVFSSLRQAAGSATINMNGGTLRATGDFFNEVQTNIDERRNRFRAEANE